MSDSDTSQPEQPRTRIGCFLLLIPAMITASVLIGYVVMWTIGLQGREVDGDRYTMTYTSCPAALDLIKARVARMGLGDPQYTTTESGFSLEARLPSEADVAAEIPKTLGRTGALEIHEVGVPEGTPPVIRADQVDDASVHLGMNGIVTLVRLNDEGAEALRKHMVGHSDGRIRYVLDGETIFERSNLPAEPRGSLELEPPKDMDEVKQLRVAAERDVIIAEGPLPCTTTLVSATPVGKTDAP